MVDGINWLFVDALGRLYHARPDGRKVDDLPPGGCGANEISDGVYECALCNAEWTLGGAPVCAIPRVTYERLKEEE